MWGTSELTCHNVPIAFPASFDAFHLSTSVAWLVTSSARFSFSPHQCFVDVASRLPNRSSPLTLASSLDGLSMPSGYHGAHQSAPHSVPRASVSPGDGKAVESTDYACFTVVTLRLLEP